MNQVVELSAEEASASVQQEKAYAERQEQIDGTWFAEITEDGCAPLEIEYGALEEDAAAGEAAAEETGVKQSRRAIKARLVEASKEVYGSRDSLEWCGSMMIMAHFGYLNSEQQFRTHDKYGLASVHETSIEPMPLTESLHDVVSSSQHKHG